VLGLDVLVVLPERVALRRGQGLLQLGGEFLESHITPWEQMGIGPRLSSLILALKMGF
jgi:hypothetical protein